MGEIPIFQISKSPGMTIQEIEMRSATVKVRVDIVLLRHSSDAAVIKHPNHMVGLRH